MSNKIRYSKKTFHKPKLIDTSREIEPEIERVKKAKFIDSCKNKLTVKNYSYCILRYRWCPFEKCGDYKKRG